MEMEETMKSAVRQENEERDKRIARQNNSRPVQVQQQVVYETKKEEKPMYVSGDGKIRIFVCNYWKDFNENGVLDLEECVGINNNFKQKDVICPVVQIFNSKGKKYEQRLYGPKGQKIEVLCFDRILPLEDQAITPYTQELLKILKKELSEAGVGAFKQVVYIDDKYTGSFEFTIEE
jgi:hypothetical protein